jgi:hypothetical protein
MGLIGFTLAWLVLLAVGQIWAALIVAAILTALSSLLAIWLAFGAASFPRRAALAVLPGVLLSLPILTSSYGLDRGVLIVSLTLVSLAPLISSPSFALRSLGYRLVRLHCPQASREIRIDDRPIQFSLRQLFGLTAAVAICAFFARLIGQQPIDGVHTLEQIGGVHHFDGLVIVGNLAVLASSAAGVAWIALGQRNPARLLLVSATAGAIASLLLGVPYPSLVTATWMALSALLTAGILLMFRRLGYRLLRVRVDFEPRGDDRLSV